MNISETMKALFERQIGHELHNHQIYRYFSNRMNNIGLTKIGTFLKSQAEGEISHQEKLISYCEDRNVDVEFVAIDSVDLSYVTILDIAQLIREVERKTTAMLKEMAMIAFTEGDLLTYEWLMKDLILEQIEEEDVSQTFVDLLTNVGNDMAMIQLLDNNFPL
jgi:ferritin